MSVAMIGPKFYAFDKNGKPLAFGKLYTYQARTNTPKDTYQSEDQQVANTNPVVLNGEGYANVYLDGSYKMVLKDSDDNEIWSSDPVSSNIAEEWVDCQDAVYLSPNSFKITGNKTNSYELGRRVRIDNGLADFHYSTILGSSFSSGETTVTLSDPIVEVGIVESCVSIVGPNSILGSYVLDFDTLEDTKQSLIIKEGDTVNVSGRHDPADGGGAFFDAALTSTVTPNGYNVIQLTNSPDISIVLRTNGVINIRQWGAKGDGVTDDSDVFIAAINYAQGQEIFIPKGHYRITKRLDDGQPIPLGGDKALAEGTPIRMRGVAGSWQHSHIVDNSDNNIVINQDDLNQLLKEASVIFCDNTNMIGGSDTATESNYFASLRELKDLAVYGDNGADMGVHIRPLATTIQGCFFSHFESFGVITRSGITFTMRNTGFDTNGFGRVHAGSITTSPPDYGSGCNLKIGSKQEPQTYDETDILDRPTTFLIEDVFGWASNRYVQAGVPPSGPSYSGLRMLQVHGLVGSVFNRVGGYQGMYFDTVEDVTLISPYIESYPYNGETDTDLTPIGIRTTNSRLLLIQDSNRNLNSSPSIIEYLPYKETLLTDGEPLNKLKARGTSLITELERLFIGVNSSNYEVDVQAPATAISNLETTDGTAALYRLANGTKAYFFGIDTDATSTFKLRDAGLSQDLFYIDTLKQVTPGLNNQQNLGSASLLWKEVFAANGTINTSDGRFKTEVKDLSEAERKVAVKLKGLIKSFKMIESVEEKGDKARKHIGLLTQDVEEAFGSEGLDAHDYSLFCYDEWDDKWVQSVDEDHKPIFDEDKKPVMELRTKAGNKYGLRYSQVLAFIISSI